MKIKKILCLLLLVSFSLFTAQAQKNNSVKEIVKERFAQTNYQIDKTGLTDKSAVENYLAEHFELGLLPETSFHLLYEKKSPVGMHYTFEQRYKDIPLLHSMVKVNVTKTGKVISITDYLYDTKKINETVSMWSQKIMPLSQEQLNRIVENSLLEDGDYVVVKEAQQTWWIDEANDGIYLGINVHIESIQNHQELEVVIAEDGTILYERETSVHFCNPVDSTDNEIGMGMVFLPDPLTSAQTTYGGNYTDQNDNNIEAVNSERVLVELNVDFQEGIYRLRNDYVSIEEFSSPNIPAVTSTNGDFFYLRGEDGFEDVNAFYHITEIQDYIQSLGFDDLGANDQLIVDTHALDGADNSFFNPSSFSVVFGEGGVDDAEDADVVIHEYTHGLSHLASPGSNTGSERQAIDEALGDYLATSYSRSFSDYGWERMFSWDGHNEYWQGRRVDTDKHYPEDVVSNIYGTAEIYSSVLMEIWDELGRETTDCLVLNSLYLLSSNMTVADAAQTVLAVDDNLKNGENKAVLQSLFQKRGLLTFIVDAGVDQSVCLGDTLVLGSPNNLVGDHLEITWSGGFVVEGSDTYEPTIIADEDKVYTLSVEDTGTGEVYTDEVSIEVSTCSDPNQITEIELRNTEAFAAGFGNPVLLFPEGTEDVTVQLVDAQGRVMFAKTQSSNEEIRVNGGILPAGIYILEVDTNLEEKKIFKIMKGGL